MTGGYHDHRVTCFGRHHRPGRRVGSIGTLYTRRFIAERAGSQFPLGTFFINVTGAFAIGLLFAFAGRKLINPAVQSLLATGFLGGYTTFSTMSWEGVQLARGGSTRLSLLYLAGNVAVRPIGCRD